MSFFEAMRELEQCEIEEVSGCGYLTASGTEAALSAILGGAAYVTAEAGLASATVPVIGTALGGFLEAGAAVMGVGAGVAYLLGD
ncbi:hypothetical protein [Dyella thiooxydans]|uniref:hypothetical protein n=1 Tax=Dyella thiooxydans TaxID=445710 RepID=UPI0007C438C9|nr:hypothetical protein [Dyella thiooxydans]